MLIDPLTLRAFQPSTEPSLQALFREELARGAETGAAATAKSCMHNTERDAENRRAGLLANAGRFVRLA